MTPSCRDVRSRDERGLVLLALLLALALAGIAALAAADVWAIERRRGQEQELLFVGDQFRRAIQRYYASAPQGTTRMLPSRLEDLLADDRHPTPLRHLRRLYPDPITGEADWDEVRIGGRLAGVHSRSDRAPLKQAGFGPDDESFEGSKSYRDWQFAVSATGGPYTGDGSAAETPPADVPPAPPDTTPRHPDPVRTPNRPSHPVTGKPR